MCNILILLFFLSREVLKTQPQQQTQSAAKIDGAPPRPPKRRRLSNGSAPPSPQKTGQSSPSVVSNLCGYFISQLQHVMMEVLLNDNSDQVPYRK